MRLVPHKGTLACEKQKIAGREISSPMLHPLYGVSDFLLRMNYSRKCRHYNVLFRYLTCDQATGYLFFWSSEQLSNVSSLFDVFLHSCFVSSLLTFESLHGRFILTSVLGNLGQDNWWQKAPKNKQSSQYFQIALSTCLKAIRTCCWW